MRGVVPCICRDGSIRENQIIQGRIAGFRGHDHPGLTCTQGACDRFKPHLTRNLCPSPAVEVLGHTLPA